MTETVYCYYVPVLPNQEEEIAVWKASWERYGWRTEVLNHSAVEEYPGLADLERRFCLLPTVNPKAFEMACYLRWLALAMVGGGLLTDYDCLNMGFTPEEYAAGVVGKSLISFGSNVRDTVFADRGAATIMAMAADEILMGPASSLGPIDAQMGWQGKVFSAHALLEGFSKIKQEVVETGQLNKAYIPILQGISPGELQSAQNALDFAKTLVKQWLAKYKFKNWDVHASTGAKVTDADRESRADEIAGRLCNHGEWLTHARSLKIDDLEGMRLRITDFSKDANLAEPIRRYHTLLQMAFSGTNIYKVFETPESQVYRYLGPAVPPPQQAKLGHVPIILDATCPRCTNPLRVQANLGQRRPLQAGCLPFPANNKLKCPACSAEIDLGDTRRQIELQTKKKIVV